MSVSSKRCLFANLGSATLGHVEIEFFNLEIFNYFSVSTNPSGSKSLLCRDAAAHCGPKHSRRARVNQTVTPRARNPKQWAERWQMLGGFVNTETPFSSQLIHFLKHELVKLYVIIWHIGVAVNSSQDVQLRRFVSPQLVLHNKQAPAVCGTNVVCHFNIWFSIGQIKLF